MGLDLDDPSAKKRAGSVAHASLKEGELIEVEDRDPIRCEMAVFVRAA
jgi:hypothetical protein